MDEKEHEDRSTYLGSHDTSAIVGDNPFMNRMDVYLAKKKLTDGIEQTERMTWGLKLQPQILDAFSERKGVELEPERFIRHKKLTWFGGTPDGTIKGRKEGVDAKCIRFAGDDWGDEDTDQVPRYILWQCHHFMTLMNYDRWHVAALVGGQELRCYKVERDKELSDMIIEADRAFWEEHVLKEIPPEIDGSGSAKTYLDKKYVSHDEEIRVATDAEADLMLKLKDARTQLEEARALELLYQNKLRQAIGENAGLASEYGKITWKQQKGRMTFDSRSLQLENKELYEKYLKQGEPMRVFRVNFTEGK